MPEKIVKDSNDNKIPTEKAKLKEGNSENDKKIDKKPQKNKSKIVILIASVVAAFLIIAIILGVFFYSQFRTSQKQNLESNYNSYVEVFSKTVEVFKAQDAQKIEDKEKAEVVKTQINEVKSLITKNQDNLKTSVNSKIKDFDKQIVGEFKAMNSILSKTIVYVDLDWCAATQYSEFTQLAARMKSINRDSKIFDTSANLKARFDESASLYTRMHTKIETTLKCFDTYLNGYYPITDDLKVKLKEEIERYKGYALAYTEMSQAAVEQNNVKLAEAQKKVGWLITVYFESSLKTYFSSIAESLRKSISDLEKNKEIMDKSKNEIAKTL
jgi:hypothetical protein